MSEEVLGRNKENTSDNEGGSSIDDRAEIAVNKIVLFEVII
jgi:hypothetical protein